MKGFTITQAQANGMHWTLIALCAAGYILLPKFIPNLTAQQADALQTYFGGGMLVLQGAGQWAIGAVQQQSSPTPPPPPQPRV